MIPLLSFYFCNSWPISLTAIIGDVLFKRQAKAAIYCCIDLRAGRSMFGEREEDKKYHFREICLLAFVVGCTAMFVLVARRIVDGTMLALAEGVVIFNVGGASSSNWHVWCVCVVLGLGK